MMTAMTFCVLGHLDSDNSKVKGKRKKAPRRSVKFFVWAIVCVCTMGLTGLHVVKFVIFFVGISKE